MNTKQPALRGLKILAALCCMANPLSADQFGCYTYIDNGPGITITDYTCADVGPVVIPGTIIGKPVTAIGDGAFSYYGGMTSVTIPGTVTSIGEGAFKGCSGLTGVMTLPSGVTNIGEMAFKGCSGLTGVTIPSGVTRIWDSTFERCSGLATVTIPSGVTSIGNWAFERCNGLISVTIPASVTSIGTAPFQNCKGMTSIAVNGANPNFSSNADGVLFDKSGTTLIQYPAGKAGTCTIAKTVTSIADQALAGCSGLTSILVDGANPNYSSADGVIFDKLKKRLIQYPAGKAGPYTTIPASVTTIGSAAFGFCSGLTGVTIPAGVTSIEDVVFYGCSGLTSISVDAANPNLSSAGGVLFDKPQHSLLAYPPGKIGSYTVPPGVTSIGDYAFITCGGLTGVTIPGGVTRIGDYAFHSCGGLTSVTIPASVTSIGVSTFELCSGLASVNIPDSMTSIGDGAFLECCALTSVTIPDKVTSVAEGAFESCRRLTSATFMGNAPEMGSYVFDSTAGGFTVYYYDNKTGFTSPTWMGYPAVKVEGDDFNGPSIDLSKWGPQLPLGGPGGQLVQTNGRLEFAGTNGVARRWIGSYGSYTQDWEVVVDVNLGSAVLTQDDSFIFATLGVCNNNDTVTEIGLPGDHIVIDLNLGYATPGPMVRSVGSYYGTNYVDEDDPLEDAVITSQHASLRLSFDATTKTVNTWYDADGEANGYNWTTLGSVPINAPGTNWEMDDSSLFGFFLLAVCDGYTVTASDQVYADNFRVTGSVLPPPAVITQPSNASVLAGQNATFTVDASGTPPPTFHWEGSSDGGSIWNDLANAAPYSGATTTTLTVSNATAGISRYQFRCVATNSGGSTPSDAALLRVAPTTLNFSGSDDFATSALWSAPTIISGETARLTFASNRLEYTVSSPSSDDAVLREWTPNVGSYTQDWAVRVDVHLASMVLADGAYANLNLIVANAADATNSIDQMDLMAVAIDRYGDGGTTVHNFEGSLVAYYAGTAHDTGLAEVPDNATDAALRISFNAATKELSSWYDANGAAGGYAWTLLQTYNIDSGTYAWNMTDSSTFSVALAGGSGGATLSSGQAYFDNFMATGSVLAPPVVTTGPATDITSTSATLTGTVNPNGLMTTAQFEYGLTTSYGSTAGVTLSPNNGTTAQNVSASISGLQSGTTYHYRLTATNTNGTSVGEDMTFVTVALPAPEIAVEQPLGTNLTDGSASIDFGSTDLGTNVVKTFTIKNLGTATLTGLAMSKDGTNAADFTVGALGAATLAAGASTTFTVTFTPGAAGLRTAAIHIASNDADENPFDINLTGTAIQSAPVVWSGPTIAFSKAPLADWTLPQNQDRITDNVWLTRANTNGPFNIKTESSFTHTLSPAGTELAYGTTADYATLTFDDWETWTGGQGGGPPNTVGRNAVVHLLSGNIYIDIKFTSWDSGGGGGFSYLRSTPGMPKITVEQPDGTALTSGSSTVNFGSRLTGAPGSLTFTITNTGTALLTGIAVTKDGTNSADYALTTASPTSIAAGDSTTFVVTFTPSAAGTRVAALHIASNSMDDNPFDINLTGTGTAASTRLQVYSGGLIQPAIDAAIPGETVVVHVGTYNEALILRSGINVKGENATLVTLRPSTDPGVLINNCTGTEFSGFTVTPATDSTAMIGIKVSGGSPLVKNNIVTGFSHEGIRLVSGCTAHVICNRIQNNGDSGNSFLDYGILCLNSKPLISNNLISGNECGCYVGFHASDGAQLINNTVVGNTNYGLWCNQSNPVVKNNIVTGNSWSGISASFGNATPVLTYNDSWGNNWVNYDAQQTGVLNIGTDSLSVDPLFDPSLPGDYRLTIGSQCRDAGDPDAVYSDIDGSRNDMGWGAFVVVDPNDYNTWSNTPALGLTVGVNNSPFYDPDHDGLNNHQEYAFGLYPTLGSSANRISVPLNNTTGTFSYTRRNPALTGLTYTVWTLVGPVPWTQDACAVQTVDATNGDVQTVTVTLSIDANLLTGYTVTVDGTPPTSSYSKDILTFNFGTLGPAAISGTNISLAVPYGTNVTALAPTFTLSPGATCDHVSGAAYDFTNPVLYAVLATDLTTKTYTVTVTQETPPIAEAIDQPGLAITNGGTKPWFAQNTITYDGIDAAQSGDIPDSQSSTFSLSATGPGTVSFWWKVSSESNWDYLTFHIDGVEQSGRISGTVDWQQKSYTLSAGSHTLRWVYAKDESDSSGSDCGWVDQVVLPASGTPLETWRLTWFGSPDNIGDGADHNDYEKDGLPNLIEFAFGLYPKQNSAGLLPRPQRSGDNFVVSFTQPPGVSGITYGAEWSETLLPGSWTAITDTGTPPLHTFSVPIGTKTKLYMRLKVTSP